METTKDRITPVDERDHVELHIGKFVKVRKEWFISGLTQEAENIACRQMNCFMGV